MISNQKEVLDIVSEFLNEKKVVEIIDLHRGHINDSYIIKMPNYQYILQRINTNVFTRPYGMMNNIYKVTKHIKRQVTYDGDNPQRAVLNLVRTQYGELLCIRDNAYWRMVEFISDSESYENVPTKEVFYEMGKIIGKFQKLLSNFPSKILDESIPHFHDTEQRYKNFLNTISCNNERIEKCKYEIDFFNTHSDLYGHIIDLIKKKEIPQRVIHNDTKPNNILFDVNTKKALCMIDLDTVMNGSILYDYGDALRIGASTHREDDPNIDYLDINLSYIERFTYAFLEELKNVIKPKEVQNLYYGYLIMTLEVGMRFLNDYFNYDKYFKINYDDHNLVRARNQIAVAKKIEENKDKIIKIINNCLKELNYKDKYFIQDED